MLLKLPLSILLLWLLANPVYSQDKSTAKFGNVTEKDFATKIYSLDSNANAVVLADIGSSDFEGNNKGWFSLVFKHFKRVHILNKNGYDVADVEIPLYSDGDLEEQLDRLKAVTYNLENGKVVETKLDVKANVFKDKIDKNWVVKKFTFPNIKEGSIIEFEYTVISDYLQNLRSWEFQGKYPRIWSEYNVSIPQFFSYVFLTQGEKIYDINTRKERSEAFNVVDGQGIGSSDRYRINANVADYKWVKKNVKPLKEESYTSTINNHIAKIEFQLSEYREPLVYKRVMGTWEKLTEDLLKSEIFGDQLSKDNGWLKDIVRPVTAGASGSMDKAKRIYAFVRDNYTCTDHSDLFLGQTLKSVAKSRNGTVSEINLLLTAMMKYENIDADPVILSTRSHGYVFALYPILSRFNYVITRVGIDGQSYYLDASEPGLGFGHLPVECYNGHARIVNPAATAIQFDSESLKETSFTSVFVINDDKGNLIGSMQKSPGYYESLSYRSKIREKGAEQLKTDLKKSFGMEAVFSNFHIDSVDRPDDPIKVSYDFDMVSNGEDIIYMNPMFGEGYKENPFKSAERAYPVEMPFTFDETYNLQTEVPAGYVVDELPKSMVVKLNEEGDGVFEYRLSQSGNTISFRSRITMNRAYFLPEEYDMLREFFGLVVKKQAEQIVFKKK
ncbi:MAG TPA: transglutaminase domain-containing protein [Chitinophagaceae bacterium]|nr:transglutaminase domain-containing protein [Chitinophagaceae bacterium]